MKDGINDRSARRVRRVLADDPSVESSAFSDWCFAHALKAAAKGHQWEGFLGAVVRQTAKVSYDALTRQQEAQIRLTRMAKEVQGRALR